MVMPQYQPSFTQGYNLSPQEAVRYTLATTNARRSDFATRSRILELNFDNEDEADQVLAEARYQEINMTLCSLTSPTNSTGNDAWIK